MIEVQPPELPLFVYGTLRPGQLAYGQIEAFVDEDRTVRGLIKGYAMWVRDGLPYVASARDQAVHGDLLWPRRGQADAFLNLVRSYEGNKLYSETTTEVRLPGGEWVDARIFVGRRVGRGNPEAVVHGEWNSWADPLLVRGLDAVSRAAQALLAPPKPSRAELALIDSPDFWNAFVPLQGLYLVLCSALERYTTLAYGSTSEPMNRLHRLAEEDGELVVEALRLAAAPVIHVEDSRSAKDGSETDGPGAFEGWYQVRSNLAHRGKTGYLDYTLVETALVGLHDTLRCFLALKGSSALAADFAAPNKLLRNLV